MASPLLIISAVRAALRLYQAGDSAVAQAYRDKTVVFRSVPTKFYQEDITPAVLKERRRNDETWNAWIIRFDLDATFDKMMTGSDAAFDTIMQARIAFNEQQFSGVDLVTVMEEVEYARLTQWATDKDKPLPPLTRFALSFVDVAAEFISFNPGLLAKGGSAEQLVGSFAGQISSLLPDNGEFGPRHRLGGRLAGLIFRAGLESFSSNKEVFITKEHQAELVDAISTPILDAFPESGDFAQEIHWEHVLDAFAGPALNAAFEVVADHQTKFLGSKFAKDKLLGKLNLSVLNHLSTHGLEDAFTQDGVIALYRGALEVIAENPDLVFPDLEANEVFVTSLVKNFATTLSDETLISKGDIDDYGLALSLAALNAAKDNIDHLIRPGNDRLETVASETLRTVLVALTQGLGDGQRLDEIFGQELALDLVRNVLDRVASAPDILGGKEALRILIGSIHTTLAGNRRLDEVFGKETAITLVETILKEVSDHPELIGDNDLLSLVLGGITKGLAGDKRLDEIFGKEGAIELVQTILSDLPKYPELLGNADELRDTLVILGGALSADNIPKAFAADLMRHALAEIASNSDLVQSHDELEGIIKAIGEAITADKDTFLTPEDWKTIIASALRQASQNPGRLFRLEPGDPASELAVIAIETLLEGAADQVASRSKGGVLFGDTLVIAIDATLSAVASNPARAAMIFLPNEDNEGTISKVAFYIEQISAAVAVKSETGHFMMGSKEWLRIYRAILMRLMNDQDKLSQEELHLVTSNAKLLTPNGKTLISEILTTHVPIRS
ncbi:hypothetical protein J7399_14480 [Shimia sp. R9_1]|uniref:hypothetical protein n=1 Tax=Shimia sp. R9_1 TaxID=2821111 RepID=UPI001ADA9815|nr:hypothetical protein [Shimia sp. R9_1]MBO9408641.1 hypothetical protein [Shimia sp. R9_1]